MAKQLKKQNTLPLIEDEKPEVKTIRKTSPIPKPYYVISETGHPFRTGFNYHLFPRPVGEINTTPSITLPDESLTIRQVFARFSSGRVEGLARDTYYDDESDLLSPYVTMDFEHMDIAERNLIMEEIRQKRAEALENYKRNKAEEKKIRFHRKNQNDEELDDVLETFPTNVKSKQNDDEGTLKTTNRNMKPGPRRPRGDSPQSSQHEE